MPALELINVNYSYHTQAGETYALRDINLSVPAGSFVSIVGPSGCGKSTLLSIAAGILIPETGKVLVNGRPVGEAASDIGYMLQHDQLFEWRTVYGNVRLGLEIQKKNSGEELIWTKGLIKQYGLEDFCNAKPSQLSGGMRQRVALIRTLVLEPEILLLDEPFSALDYQTRLTVGDDIASIIRREHKTAVLVTHDLSEAISVGDIVYVMSKRPATIISGIPISFRDDSLSPIQRREEPEFKEYFHKIWKELNDNA